MTNGRYTPDEIRSEVKKLIAIVTEREPDEVSDTASFKDELGVDSLMAMEVMISVDRKFKIDIPEEEFTQAINVDDAVNMVLRHLPQSASASV
jgi:acyl carrier protein